MLPQTFAEPAVADDSAAVDGDDGDGVTARADGSRGNCSGSRTPGRLGTRAEKR